MKIYLSAGEESGDLHGAHLARELRALAPGVELAGMAGARMRAAGVEAVVRAESHGVVGFVEVFARLGQIKRDLDALAAAMARDGAALVAIDYGGFNARLVARARRAGLKTFYYIPPKLWAWGRGRGGRLARDLDLVLAVFPFEVAFWREAGAAVAFVGHPLLDITKPSGRDARGELGIDADDKLLLILPGSRRQELTQLWPPVAAALPAVSREVPGVRIVVRPAPSPGADALAEAAPVPPGVTTTDVDAVDLMAAADAAVVASGTASLELAIVDTPALILYKVNRLTWALGSRLVYVNHLGLPNIIAGRPVVPELLQRDVTPANVAGETVALLTDAGERRGIRAAYDEIRASLRAPAGGPATAPARAAKLIWDALAQ
jgi:lipid-A-disaccharide synthase